MACFRPPRITLKAFVQINGCKSYLVCLAFAFSETIPSRCGALRPSVCEAPSHRPTFLSEKSIWWAIHAQIFAPWLVVAQRTCTVLHRRIRTADFRRIFMQGGAFVRNHAHKGIPNNNGLGGLFKCIKIVAIYKEINVRKKHINIWISRI